MCIRGRAGRRLGACSRRHQYSNGGISNSNQMQYTLCEAHFLHSIEYCLETTCACSLFSSFFVVVVAFSWLCLIAKISMWKHFYCCCCSIWWCSVLKKYKTQNWLLYACHTHRHHAFTLSILSESKQFNSKR